MMKIAVTLCASAVAAVSIPAFNIREEGLPLSAFGQVNSVTPEEAQAGDDLRVTLHQRTEGGLPLSAFGNVHSVTLEQAQRHEDLGGNNFSALPVFGPGHHANLAAYHDFLRNGGEFENIHEVEDEVDHILEARDTGDCTNPNIRFEWDDYSTLDKNAFISAVQCLQSKPPSGRISPSANRYEDLIRLHQSMAPTIHSQSTSQQTHIFLLWHRYFVWAFERILRDECGFNRAMPWWDEKKWAGNFEGSTLFTPSYFGTLPGPTRGQGTCIYDGGFAGLKSNLGPGYATNNPHCIQRAVNEQITAQTGIDSYNTCIQRTSYPDFHSCVEFTFHAQGHNGIGATMADAVASPGDPAFFMHHLYVDYVFRKWQLGALSRRTTISGCASSNGCPPLTLDTVISLGNICANNKCPDLPVSQLLRTLQGKFCYRYNY
ncbi:hypothetical protein F5Y16DRAFT_380435 [Xylariaceae sp. FL0255]|nr:hypothetical protein F5Y16DRAFT_380435 [Xylariaceae sp. FL0255]